MSANIDCNLDSIPTEVRGLIFSYLEENDYPNIASTCQLFADEIHKDIRNECSKLFKAYGMRVPENRPNKELFKKVIDLVIDPRYENVERNCHMAGLEAMLVLASNVREERENRNKMLGEQGGPSINDVDGLEYRDCPKAIK